MDDVEEQAANSFIRSGLASDRKTSSHTVQRVIHTVLEDRAEPIVVHDGDLHSLDELAYEITCLVGEMEGSYDHTSKLLDIAERLQHLLRIARRYIAPETAREPL